MQASVCGAKGSMIKDQTTKINITPFSYKTVEDQISEVLGPKQNERNVSWLFKNSNLKMKRNPGSISLLLTLSYAAILKINGATASLL
jgi:hypothetical protein